MARRTPWLVAAGTFTALTFTLLACSKSEGPSAPARKNGCIDTGCAPVTTATPPSSSGDDAGSGSNGLTTAATHLVHGGLAAAQRLAWREDRLVVEEERAVAALDGGRYVIDVAAGTVEHVAADGTRRELPGAFAAPRGLALAPDGRTLYVVDAAEDAVLAARIALDGAVGTFDVLASVAGGEAIAVDTAGTLHVASEEGIVLLAADGRPRGTIAVGARPVSCTFGGPDRRTLFVSANAGAGNAATGLYSVLRDVPGLP